MTIKEMLLVKLDELGADGLMNGDCKCHRDNLLTCGYNHSFIARCIPAFEGIAKKIVMYPTKEEAEASKCQK